MRAPIPTLFLLLSLTGGPSAAKWVWPPEDLEASGDDLEMEGSGSGGGDEVTVDEKSTRLGRPKDPTPDHKPGPEIPEEKPWERDTAIVQESRSFMESKEVFAGVVAGGLSGLVLAVLLSGILIYKWQKKEPSGYVQGHPQPPGPRAGPRGQDVVLV